jgi:hypothetical protein
VLSRAAGPGFRVSPLPHNPRRPARPIRRAGPRPAAVFISSATAWSCSAELSFGPQARRATHGGVVSWARSGVMSKPVGLAGRPRRADGAGTQGGAGGPGSTPGCSRSVEVADRGRGGSLAASGGSSSPFIHIGDEPPPSRRKPARASRPAGGPAGAGPPVAGRVSARRAVPRHGPRRPGSVPGCALPATPVRPTGRGRR